MHNFVSLVECLNSPNAACALSPPSLLLYAVIAGLAAFGWRAGRRGAAEARIAVRRWLAIGAGLMVLSVLTIAAFFMFDPDAPLGVEKDVVSEALWLLAIKAFGLGVMIVLGTTGYGLGSRLARTISMSDKDRSQ